MMACTRCRTWMMYDERTICISPDDTVTYGVLCPWCADGWIEYAQQAFIEEHI